MFSISQLSNSDLVRQWRELIAQERQVLTRILWHLREVEARKIFADAGYPSLFEYVVRELGYSESAASRRISAMRLLKSLPTSEATAVESAIQTGALNLSKLAQAQEYFRYQAKNGRKVELPQKSEVLAELETRSARECERYFAALAPERVPAEKVRHLNEVQTEIRLIVSQELLAKIEKLKNIQSHVKHDANLAEVLEMAVDLALRLKEKLRQGQMVSTKNADPLPTSEVRNDTGAQRGFDQVAKSDSRSPRFIPADTKRFIWNRDRGKCTYQNPETGKTCGSTYQVQIDHIHPIALHGDADPKNFRLLCRTHNRREAEKVFGVTNKRG